MASDEYKKIELGLKEYERKIQIIVFQPTMIFGDLCDHNVSKFIKMVDVFPVMPMIGKGENLIQPVNARDLAGAYYTALTKEIPEGYYVLSGERPIRLTDFYEEIANNLNKKYRRFCIPLRLGILAARILKVCSIGKLDFVEQVMRMSEDRAYSHEKANETFGYEPELFSIGLKREIGQYIVQKKK